MSVEDFFVKRQAKFNRGFHFVIISEGGTNDDPLDRGGLTNWGISEKQYPNLDIAKLTVHAARQIYFQDYWLKNKCEQMGSNLGLIVFDCAVNCGQPSAAKWVQQSCNKLGSKLKVDGIIGRNTMREVHKYSHGCIQNLVIAARLRRYVVLLDKHPEQKRFIKGWIDRVSNLLDFMVTTDHELFINSTL